MSMTASPPETPPEKDRSPALSARSLIAWLRPAPAVVDEGAEVLEFYSPSAAMMATAAKPVARNAIWAIFVMVLLLFISFGIFNIDRIVSASGKVISLTPELVVQPVNPAVVRTIAVSEGDIVRKGQLLAQLDPTVAASDTTAAQEQLDRYQTEVDRLGAELHAVPYKPKSLTGGALVQENIFIQRAAARDAQLRYYQGQIDAQHAQILAAEANISQYAKQTGVATDVERMRHQLEQQQVGSRLDTLAAVNARLEMERQVLTSVQQRETATQTLAALQGQLQSYNQQWFADVSQTLTDDSVQLANYRNQLDHAALSLKLIDLRADQDAIVLAVAPVSIGSVLQAGQTFFTLVPLNAPLEIQAQVSGDEAGFVVIGMPVSVKFTTFPYNNFGMGFGTVRLISADSFLTNANSGGAASSGTTSDMVFTGAAPSSPYFFDTRVTLDRLDLKNVPHDFHLVPGMPVQIDIKVGEQTVWDYLLVRIRPVFDEGMREPT